MSSSRSKMPEMSAPGRRAYFAAKALCMALEDERPKCLAETVAVLRDLPLEGDEDVIHAFAYGMLEGIDDAKSEMVGVTRLSDAMHAEVDHRAAPEGAPSDWTTQRYSMLAAAALQALIAGSGEGSVGDELRDNDYSDTAIALVALRAAELADATAQALNAIESCGSVTIDDIEFGDYGDRPSSRVQVEASRPPDVIAGFDIGKPS